MFVTLEGIDRSGKTTQATLLARALGPDTVLLREPGGTDVAERIRGLLKDPGIELDPRAELLLFCAARAELCARVIGPALDQGRDVVSDRFIDSTVAYQGAARGLGVEVVEQLNEVAIAGRPPHLTVLLRIDPDRAEARGQQRLAAGGSDGSDRFEGEGIGFQRAVAAAYERDRRSSPGADRDHRRRGLGRRGARARARGGRRGAGGWMTAVAEIPEALRDATEHQPAAQAALAAALDEPVHAYLLAGPPGCGKRAATRAFAAELLAAGSPNPDDARRRALADPTPHPDLVWLAPQGMQHLVEEVRRRVITAAAYRPFEAERRVFVIEAADAMADESQNALLKTLEEPAPFVHLILITSEPAALLETVRSRCQPVRFAPLAEDAVEARLVELGLGGDELERRAAARLAAGDPDRAAFLLGADGRELRAAAEACVGAARSGNLAEAPWTRVLEAAEAAGAEAGEATQARLTALAAEAGEAGPGAGRRDREAGEAAKRAARRARTEALDLGLGLIAAWLRDLAAVAEGADGLVLNADRGAELEATAAGLDGRRGRRGAELAMETRRHLQVNVGEELALEALVFRLEALLRDA